MKIEIDKLRLTQEWWDEVSDGNPTDAADAQLAKTLWGIIDWLWAQEGWVSNVLCGELREALEQAHVKRPPPEVDV